MVNNLSNGLPALIRHTPSTAEDPIAYFFSTLSDEELNTPTTVIDSMQRETAPQQEMVLRDVQNHFMHPAVVKTETMLFVPSIATTYVPGGYREELLRVKARLEEGSPATNFEIMLHSTIAQYAVTQSSGRQDYHTVTLVCQGQALYCVRQRLQGRESDDGEDGWKNTDLGEVKQGEALNMPCSAEWMMSSIPEDMKATLLLVASFVPVYVSAGPALGMEVGS